MANVIGFVWLAAVAVCVFAIIRPFAKVPVLNKRGGAIAAAIGVFIVGGLIAGGLMQLDPQVAAQQAKEAATAKAQKEADDHPGPPTKEAQAQFLARHAIFRKASQACDLAMHDMGRTMSRGNQYDSYQAAQYTAETCGQASTDIEAITYEAPVAAHAQTDLKAAMKACGQAYGMRAFAARETGKAIDKGDLRPSTVEGSRQLFAAADSGVLQCAAGYVGVARKWGYKIPEVQHRR